MIILLTGLQSIPQHLYEAARWSTAWPAGAPLPPHHPAAAPPLDLPVASSVGILNTFTSFDLV